MNDIRLVTTKLSSYGRTARLALEEKGLKYTVSTVDFTTVGKSEHRRLHPFAKVPVFYHGKIHLYETAAIARYIDEAFDGPPLQPRNPVDRAQMEKWISNVNNYLYPCLIRLLVWERVVVPMQGGKTDETIVASCLNDAKMQLQLLDRELSGNDFVAGSCSLADLFLVPIVSYASLTPEAKDILPSMENLSAWLERMTKRQSWVASS